MPKLVRDKVPDLMRAKGQTPTVTIDQGLAPLYVKAREELAGLESTENRERQIEKCADLHEIFGLITDRLMITKGLLRDQVSNKQRAEGEYHGGTILHEPVSASDKPTPLVWALGVMPSEAEHERYERLFRERGFEVAATSLHTAYHDLAIHAAPARQTPPWDLSDDDLFEAMRRFFVEGKR